MSNSYKGQYISVDFQNIGAENPHFDTHNFLYEMELYLNKEIQREIGIVVNRLEQVTRTWNHDVKFYYEMDNTADTFFFTVTTDDEIFWYLNNGTDKRYAVMTNDFIPKTKVRTIGSSRGRGGFSHFDPNDARAAMRGIEARDWIEEIAERREKYFPNNMSKVFNHILDKYWRWAHK